MTIVQYTPKPSGPCANFAGPPNAGDAGEVQMIQALPFGVGLGVHC